MTPEQATDLAARTLAAIGRQDMAYGTLSPTTDADRERVASDLAGFLEACRYADVGLPGHRAAAERFADNLRRTAALYGVMSEPTGAVARRAPASHRARCPFCCAANDGKSIPVVEGAYARHLAGSGLACSGSGKSLRALPPLVSEATAAERETS